AAWHRRLLQQEASVLGYMDRRDEQIAAYDRYDARYDPDLTVLRIWPLVKLARFDEAREIGNKLVHSDNAYVRQRALNGMMAIEEEAGNRMASYEWGQKAMAATANESCVINTNTALGARRVFKFAEAIALDQQALKAPDKDCPTPPYAQLAPVYLVGGRFQECLSTLQALRATPLPADIRPHNQMVIKARLVELLLALGAFEEAESRAREILAAPDRMGYESGSKELKELGNNLLAWSVFDSRLAQLEERIAVRGLLDGVPLRFEAEQLAITRAEARREALRLALADQALSRTVRPYFSDLMPWYGADMIRVFGHGMMGKAIDEAEAAERDVRKEAALFLDAYRGEAAWLDDDLTEARRLGERTLAALPEETKLLRLRVEAWLADTLRRLGDAAAAERHFAAVMDFYPTVLRGLRIRLPVRLAGGVGPRSAAITDRLADSPRLLLQSQSRFVVDVRDEGKRIEICLQGAKRSCGVLDEEAIEALPEDADVIASAVDHFHDEVFAPRIELTQSDINSLDGRAVRQDARGAVDALLGREKKEQEKK
ncbi:MAG: hypothetical protein KC620_18695, partial [Myxococcales bacterium]|nr:hypothetical protein [Myxococcales bacterium]